MIIYIEHYAYINLYVNICMYIIGRIFKVLGNLCYEEAAHILSAVEGSSDFMIFFRPEDTKEVSVPWLSFMQKILTKGELLCCHHCKHHLIYQWPNSKGWLFTFKLILIRSIQDYKILSSDIKHESSPISGLRILRPTWNPSLWHQRRWQVAILTAVTKSHSMR